MLSKIAALTAVVATAGTALAAPNCPRDPGQCTDTTAPTQIRVAYAGDKGMAVSWKTNSQLTNPTQTSSTWNNYVVLTDLEDDATYFYKPACSDVTYTFTTSRKAGKKTPFSFAMLGDMGTFGPDGLSSTVGKGAANPLKPGDLTTIQSLTSYKDSYDFIWHVGDEDSLECKNLRELLEAALPPGVNKLVAFACSTMTIKAGQLRSRRGQQQHRPENGPQPQIQCFAQDPLYTDTDKEVLERVGVSVVQDPRGFLEVDDQTVVVSIAPNIPVRQIIADIAPPAALIWNRVTGDVKDGGHGVTDPESPRLWAMMQGHYNAVATLQSEDKFGDTVVYIRSRE
ncbi:hypothetical protein VTI74DRAFT_1133 [Chaetomium olivicolor]